MEVKLGYVILYVDSIEKTKQFYGELLGHYIEICTPTP